MVLSDTDIGQEIVAGRIVIEPLGEGCIQPASVDIRLGPTALVMRSSSVPYIDVKKPMDHLTEMVEIGEEVPFILHPGEFVLGSTLERVELAADLVARIEGKALALDTEVPTPSGWKTIGEIEPGDFVFGPDGQPLLVEDVSAILRDHECRRVGFSGGESVVADAAHFWEVWTPDDPRRGRRRIVTTQQMEGDLIRGRHGREYRFHLDQTAPVSYAAQELSIDPYVLGAWLGDGTSTAAEITSASGEVIELVRAAGSEAHRVGSSMAYRVGGAGHTRDAATGRYAANSSLSSRLRLLGLFGDKHIPALYLRASIAQRLSLLQGIMDTDGYVDSIGRCEVTTKSARLASGYRELIASLGYRTHIQGKLVRGHGPYHRVTFVPHGIVFRLPRKAIRQSLVQRFNFGHSIRAIDPTASVPVRCIRVASARGAFLITRSYIPTHNSSLGRLGLLIHSTAGYVDPGWKGVLTLELHNIAPLPITLYHKMKIGQLSFLRLTSPALRPYGDPSLGSRYHGQSGPEPSQYHRDYKTPKVT